MPISHSSVPTSIAQHRAFLGRSLLTPGEVRTLPAYRQILFLAGQRPVITTKPRYHADREFAGRFDPA